MDNKELIGKTANALGFHLLDTGVYDHAKDAERMAHELAEIAIPIIQAGERRKASIQLKRKAIDCPAHRLVGSIHYCGIGSEGDLICWCAYHQDCGWGQALKEGEA